MIMGWGGGKSDKGQGEEDTGKYVEWGGGM